MMNSVKLQPLRTLPVDNESNNGTTVKKGTTVVIKDRNGTTVFDSRPLGVRIRDGVAAAAGPVALSAASLVALANLVSK
jgi:hypothetical protein